MDLYYLCLQKFCPTKNIYSCLDPYRSSIVSLSVQQSLTTEPKVINKLLIKKELFLKSRNLFWMNSLHMLYSPIVYHVMKFCRLVREGLKLYNVSWYASFCILSKLPKFSTSLLSTNLLFHHKHASSPLPTNSLFSLPIKISF